MVKEVFISFPEVFSTADELQTHIFFLAEYLCFGLWYIMAHSVPVNKVDLVTDGAGRELND